MFLYKNKKVLMSHFLCRFLNNFQPVVFKFVIVTINTNDFLLVGGLKHAR